IPHSGEARQYHSPGRLTVAAMLCLGLAACAIGPAGTNATNTAPSPTIDSAASGPRFSQPPVTPPSPPVTNLPAFACADASGGKVGVANVTAVRAYEPAEYD